MAFSLASFDFPARLRLAVARLPGQVPNGSSEVKILVLSVAGPRRSSKKGAQVTYTVSISEAPFLVISYLDII